MNPFQSPSAFGSGLNPGAPTYTPLAMRTNSNEQGGGGGSQLTSVFGASNMSGFGGFSSFASQQSSPSSSSSAFNQPSTGFASAFGASTLSLGSPTTSGSAPASVFGGFASQFASTPTPTERSERVRRTFLSSPHLLLASSTP